MPVADLERLWVKRLLKKYKHTKAELDMLHGNYGRYENTSEKNYDNTLDNRFKQKWGIVFANEASNPA